MSLPPNDVITILGHEIDVSKFKKRHPGGEKVLRGFLGRDATQVFLAHHSKSALAKALAMGKKTTTTNPEFDAQSADLAKLVEKYEKQGLYILNPIWEVLKLLYITSFFACGVWCASIGYHWVSVFCFIMSWVQSSFAAHDFSHHAVTRFPGGFSISTRVNDDIARLLAAFQGYDIVWWKYRHNNHHIYTNHDSYDPDVKVSPVFNYRKAPVRILGYSLQSLYFLPALALLDLYWRFESIQHQYKRYNRNENRSEVVWSAILLFIHYVFMVWLVSHIGISKTLVLSYIRGFITASIVFSSHYAETRISKEEFEKMSRLEEICRTTRNIHGNMLFHMFSGYLTFQIEHHLFPMMPRYNLEKTTEDVKALCEKYKVNYLSGSIAECMMLNIKCLDVGEEMWKMS